MCIQLIVAGTLDYSVVRYFRGSTCVSICMSTHIPTNLNCVNTHSVCINVCSVHVCIGVCTSVLYTYCVYACVCIHTCVCDCVPVYVCMYVQINACVQGMLGMLGMLINVYVCVCSCRHCVYVSRLPCLFVFSVLTAILKQYLAIFFRAITYRIMQQYISRLICTVSCITHNTVGYVY